MNPIHKLVDLYSRRRYALLFVSLLSTMMVAPILGEMVASTKPMEFFLGFNVLAAALVTAFSFRVYAGFGILAWLTLRYGGALLGYEPLLATSQAVAIVMCLISACIMMRFILSEGFVTSERIFAALGVYLLIGIVCGLLFSLFMEEWPGSFSFQGSSFADTKHNLLAHMTYFSFVTLGTLGYGDIIPTNGPARALAVTESMLGQMYLVVIVARLVGLYKGTLERKTMLPSENQDLQ